MRRPVSANCYQMTKVECIYKSIPQIFAINFMIQSQNFQIIFYPINLLASNRDIFFTFCQILDFKGLKVLIFSEFWLEL